jgi:hypothetical protein
MPGTTGSTGLNNLLADTQQVQTTLPSWYDAAQQNIVNQAGTAAAGAPAFQNTVAQGAINTLSGPSNPFAQGQTALNTIASGAANPWITDASGNVTPNTATPMGGLFQAQNQQLQQSMPNITAQPNAQGIGSGQFGSLRGQTAVNKAMADAQTDLFAKQMMAALQNQQTGASAASGLGTLGAQGTTAGLTAGAAQMNAPFMTPGNYANLINSINVPGTVSQQNQMSPLSMLGSLSKAPAAASGLLSSLGINGSSLSNLGSSILNKLGLGGGGTGSGGSQTGVPAGPGAPAEVQDASGNVKEGYFQDEQGNWYGPGSNIPINAVSDGTDLSGGSDAIATDPDLGGGGMDLGSNDTIIDNSTVYDNEPF